MKLSFSKSSEDSENMVPDNSEKDKKFEDPKKPKPPLDPKFRKLLWLSLILSIFLWIGLGILQNKIESASEEAVSISYAQFQDLLKHGQIKEFSVNGGSILLKESGFYTYTFEEDKSVKTRNDGIVLPFEFNVKTHIGETFLPCTPDMVEKILLSGVKITAPEVKSTLFTDLLISLLPSILMLGLLFFFFMKTMPNLSHKQDNENIAETSILKFSDVAGMTEEKEELQFAIDSLKDRSKYLSMGARPVKGILFEGPPGTGKTMLAKAVAGEAGCKFISYAGSDFVEMFVGLGAQRIRKMYKLALENKPCVVFIDEIDALGQKRSTHSGNSEGDNTLVALLAKMDGMSTESGILFIAATNRVDTLDPALLRPGRFDKIIHIGPPKTKSDREALVNIHLRNKVLAEGVTVESLAKLCFGLTGAEIEQSLNDAVLESFKMGTGGKITLEAMDKATMKTMTKGIAKGKNHGEELTRVSVHELGHALVNRWVGRQVVKISVQPYSSGVGGVTMIDGETANMQGLRLKEEIEDDIKVLYGGYIAEKVILGSVSTGASNDLERATVLLKNYVGTWAFKDKMLLCLNALSQENPLSVDSKMLIDAMEEVAERLYQEVYTYLSQSEQKNILNRLLKILVADEVIYDLDEAIEKVSVNEDLDTLSEDDYFETNDNSAEDLN